MAENQITTLAARRKMLLARNGKKELPPIVGFAFGSGGLDADGAVIPPMEDESKLRNEVLRKPYDSFSFLSETSCRYFCTLEEGELTGTVISEVGLYDEEGDILSIKRFLGQGKDADVSMTYWIEDIF